MNKTYEAPSFEILEVELEGVLCQSSGVEDLTSTSGLSNY